MSRLAACSAAVALGLTLASSPASAASGITAPGAGEIVAAEAVVPLRAVVDAPALGPSELSLLAPGATAAEVVAVSPGAGELAYDLDTSCARPACTGRTPAANGTWALRLSGAAEDERTFVLRIPPAAPVEVSAARSEAGVIVRWQQGDEPDLRGYRVEDTAGAVVRDGIGLQACDAQRFCSVEVPEAAKGWTVRAFRATCPDCTEVLASPVSSAVRTDGKAPVVEAAGVQPSPTSAPAPVGATAQRQAFLGAFGSSRRAFAPPTAPRPAVQAAPPPAAGSYDAELGYPERELVVTAPRPPLSRASEAVSAALWTGERLRLLLLSAALVGGSLWLRRWGRRVLVEE